MKKILAVASSGGHWQQLKLLTPAFADQKVFFMTTTNNLINEKEFNFEGDYSLIKVIQANRQSKSKAVLMAFQVFTHLVRIRPDIVISTGAAPGYFAIVFGKLFRAKTIWVDSMANYEKLSMSGERAKKKCDLVLTQWPHLQGHGKYWGSLL